MLDTLSSKVSQMNEKMYDFEQNKRNNLIFYGLNQDAGETPESLAINIQKLIKDKMLLRREMNITQVRRTISKCFIALTLNIICRLTETTTARQSLDGDR